VPLIHCVTVSHLLAERVYVSVFAQRLLSGIGVTQRIQHADLPPSLSSPLSRDHTDHQPPEQWHGGELRQDVQARLRQVGSQARFTDGDGAVEGLVR